MRSFSILLIILLITLVSCGQENALKAFQWGLNKVVGDGFMPSTELLSIGDFEGAEVNFSTHISDGGEVSSIELKLYQGKSLSPFEMEENLARRCAEMYAAQYSKIHNYQIIKIIFIKIDPMNLENREISSYDFQIQDLSQ